MKYYIVTWDCEGVEAFIDVTDYAPGGAVAGKDLLASIQQGRTVSTPLPVNIGSLELRARMNPQRHYEGYVFTASDELEEQEIHQWFESDPQSFADWVRKYHTQKLFDHRAQKTAKIV